MKKVAALCLSVLIYCAIQAQEKGDNAIVVKGVDFAQVKNVLLDNGYFIDQQNEQDGTIVTRETNADDARSFGQNLNRFNIILYVRVSNSTAVITGQMRFTEEEKKEWHPVEFWKSKGSVPYHLFAKMDKIAQGLKGELSYVKN